MEQPSSKGGEQGVPAGLSRESGAAEGRRAWSRRGGVALSNEKRVEADRSSTLGGRQGGR